MNDARCLSSCEVLPGVLKRCQATGPHDGHYWIEAVRADGRRAVARWFGPDAARPDELFEERGPAPSSPAAPCTACGGSGVVEHDLGGASLMYRCSHCADRRLR